MRILFIALLSVGLLYYLIYLPFLSKGYRQQVNWLMVICLTVTLVPTGYMEYKWQKIESFGTLIVKDFSKNEKGHLKCQRFFNTMFDTAVSTAGYVDYSEPNKAIVKYEMCKDLESYFKDPLAPTFKQSQSFHVLLHESAHVAGIQNEAEAECKAVVNHVDAASRYLGSMQTITAKNMIEYGIRVTPNMPSRYHSSDNCKSVK